MLDVAIINDGRTTILIVRSDREALELEGPRGVGSNDSCCRSLGIIEVAGRRVEAIDDLRNRDSSFDRRLSVGSLFSGL